MAEKHFVIKAEQDETLVVSPYRLSDNPNTELVLKKRVRSDKDKDKQYWVLQEDNMLRTFYNNNGKHFFVTDVGDLKPVQVQENPSSKSFILKNGQFHHGGKVLSISGGLNENAHIALRQNCEGKHQFWKIEYIE